MKWEEFTNFLNQRGITEIPVYPVGFLKHQCIRDLIQQCDIIWGKGEGEQSTCLLYGKRFLRECVKSKKPVSSKFCIIDLDYDTEELEYVCGVITAIKGHCDYGPENKQEKEHLIRMWTSEVYKSESKTDKIITAPTAIGNRKTTPDNN